ncbi:MAG: hypothetical protein WD751_06530 [Anaerolineales bacterium]
MKKQKALRPQKELTPITVYVCAAGLGLLGYLLGEFVLGSRPHPLHWVTGIVGIALGYLLGKLVVRRYGDFFGF